MHGEVWRRPRTCSSDALIALKQATVARFNIAEHFFNTAYARTSTKHQKTWWDAKNGNEFSSYLSGMKSAGRRS
jgi:hypothetical protein